MTIHFLKSVWFSGFRVSSPEERTHAAANHSSAQVFRIGLALFLITTSYTNATGRGESNSDNLYHPSHSASFGDLPQEARDFFRRAYSCGEYGSLEVGEATKEELQQGREKRKKLSCARVSSDGKRLRKKYRANKKVQKAFKEFDEAG